MSRIQLTGENCLSVISAVNIELEPGVRGLRLSLGTGRVAGCSPSTPAGAATGAIDLAAAGPGTAQAADILAAEEARSREDVPS
jgi:hypothetical protein